MVVTSNPRRLVFALLGAGVALWGSVLWAGYNGALPIRPLDSLQIKILGLSTAACLIGKVRRSLFRLLNSARHPSPRGRRLTALIITLLAGVYLYGTAIHQNRDFFPKLHDEHMHLIQMQLLARGELSLPAHPMADFFETFHVFNTPVYAPMHFPGTSLLYVPAVWLHLPAWFMPLCVAAGIVGLIYLLLTELIDGVAGCLGSTLTLSVAPFRFVSLMVLSNAPAMLFGLLMFWAWLQWRKKPAALWALCIGIFAGLAAITRPPDALCFAIPIGFMMLRQLIRGHRRPHYARWWAATTTAVLCGAAPFLALQLSFDHQVTGHWLHTPHDEYSRRYNPGVNYGLRTPDLTLQPQTTLLQKQIYYTSFVKPSIESHRPDHIAEVLIHQWIPTAVRTALPSAILLVFVPLGFLGLKDARRQALVLIWPLGIAFYSLSVMISWYYLLFTMPAVLLCVLLGCRQVEIAWPAVREWTSTGLSLLIISFCIAALPEARNESLDQFMAPSLKAVIEKLRDIHEPALVLFTFHAGDNIHEEPVYNIDVANPDDAPIIRAQDLGPRNHELFEYYAKLQPNRRVFRFDRHSNTLYSLGNVKELLVGNSVSSLP